MTVTGRIGIFYRGFKPMADVVSRVAILVAGTLAFWLGVELAIRYIGLGLQLLGTGAVVADLLNKGKKYHLRTPFKRLSQFLWQIIRPPPPA